ncbi:MAG: hypothetical protein KDB79_03955, partial [Acidobacteria bacterium]|nr:hypothetical protein [Acidobacteriota bacterium]
LVGVAGLQFFYLLYLDRVAKEHKKRVRELEKYCTSLSDRLHAAEEMIRLQPSPIADSTEFDDEETWADILEER